VLLPLIEISFCVLTGAGCFARARLKLVSNALIFKNIEAAAKATVTSSLPTRFRVFARVPSDHVQHDSAGWNSQNPISTSSWRVSMQAGERPAGPVVSLCIEPRIGARRATT